MGGLYPCLIVDNGGLYIVSTVLTQTGVTLYLCCSHCFGSIPNPEILFRFYTIAVPWCYNNYKRKRVVGGCQVGLVDELKDAIKVDDLEVQKLACKHITYS